jgi:hypothetical protein
LEQYILCLVKRIKAQGKNVMKGSLFIMAFVGFYNVAYSDTVDIIGREEITENISLTASPAVNSGNLRGLVTDTKGVSISGATVKYLM